MLHTTSEESIFQNTPMQCAGSWTKPACFSSPLAAAVVLCNLTRGMSRVLFSGSPKPLNPIGAYSFILLALQQQLHISASTSSQASTAYAHLRPSSMTWPITMYRTSLQRTHLMFRVSCISFGAIPMRNFRYGCSSMSYNS